MNTLSYIKSHKLITSIITASAVVLTGGTVAIATLNNKPEQVAQVEMKTSMETPAPTPTPSTEPAAEIAQAETETTVTVSPQPSSTPKAEAKSTNPYAGPSQLSYVYDKRKNAGKSVFMGPARMWVGLARQAGVQVDRAPQVADVYSMGDYLYYVEAVSDASVTVSTYLNSEMTKTISREEASVGWFIH